MALNCYAPAHLVEYVSDIVQSDAVAPHILTVAVWYAIEFVEYEWQTFGRYADSIIRNFYSIGVYSKYDSYRIAGVFDGIVDQIVQHVGQV